MDRKEKCHKCGKEFLYNENQDKENNELIPMKIRKTVIDPKNQVFPFYAMPKDKQRIVDSKYISFTCLECSKIA